MERLREGNVAAARPRGGFMDLALAEAARASQRGEVPVGAVLVFEGEAVARAGNETRARRDPTAHAEMLVIREAARLLRRERLNEADLYVTLEPCAMCAAAASFARLRRLYFGAADEKGGAVVSGPRFYASAACHHAPEVYPGIGEVESAALLRRFFAARRDGG